MNNFNAEAYKNPLKHLRWSVLRKYLTAESSPKTGKLQTRKSLITDTVHAVSMSDPEAYWESYVTPNMTLFVIIANGWKELTIFAKHCILDAS